MITFTTNIPSKVELYENIVDDPANFDPLLQDVVPTTEPLLINPSQFYDYDAPANFGDTPDALFGLYGVHFIADASGTTTHNIQIDPSATRIVYEVAGKRTTTAPPVVVPTIERYACVYVWISSGTTRFPD